MKQYLGWEKALAGEENNLDTLCRAQPYKKKYQ
jgi:hypothetical protein